MRRPLTGAFEASLRCWVDIARKYRLLIVLAIFAGAFFCLRYTIDNISMNTDTRDMLSPKLEWRNFALEVDEKFPQYNDLILVVVEAGTADEASDAGRILYEQLLSEDKLFKSVYYPSGLPFFKQSAFLYLDTTELQDLADNLAAVQPFLARLTEDQSLRGLFTMLTEAIEAKLDGDEIDIEPLLKDINSALIAIQNNQHYRLSWQRLMGGLDEDRSVYREFIVLQPNLDYGGAFPARDSIDRIHRLADEYQLNQQNHINVRLTGNVTMSYEEMISVSRGMEISVIIALCLVAVVLVVGLRSVWMVLATLVTLVNGLIYT
ncbi:MAG TPA: MMPL family transporter, partial [Gammaproteobacteria bacterium]